MQLSNLFTLLILLTIYKCCYKNNYSQQLEPLAAVQSCSIVASGFNPHFVHTNLSILLSKKSLYNDWKYGSKCTPIICTFDIAGNITRALCTFQNKHLFFLSVWFILLLKVLYWAASKLPGLSCSKSFQSGRAKIRNLWSFCQTSCSCFCNLPLANSFMELRALSIYSV